MDTIWDKSLNQNFRRHSQQYQRENPSFSSTLLDAIYRSIDESNDKEDEKETAFCRETMKKKHSNGDKSNSRACKIEKWIEEKHTCEKKVSVRRKSMEEKESHDHYQRRQKQQPVLLNSSSSSSESSCGGGFSSSESDSFYTAEKQRPKPIRTSVSLQSEKYQARGEHIKIPAANYAPNQESGSFAKSKSKALKIYGDLKKAKQPISPGGRLAAFLNSLFSTAGNAKKAKISSYDDRKLKSEQNSTCSSASSFSRSCLSKTPSSSGKLKRSVRFYPVSVIVGEDSRPCGHKNVCEEANQQKSALIAAAKARIANSNSNSKSNSHSIDDELKIRVSVIENVYEEANQQKSALIAAAKARIANSNSKSKSNSQLIEEEQKSRRVEEVARDLLKNYQKKQQIEEEEDDLESCASSDLFELDNLSAIGIERYCEELPVYETTHFSGNSGFGNGLLV